MTQVSFDYSAAVVLLNFPSVVALGFESASWEGRMMDCA